MLITRFLFNRQPASPLPLSTVTPNSSQTTAQFIESFPPQLFFFLNLSCLLLTFVSSNEEVQICIHAKYINAN